MSHELRTPLNAIIGFSEVLTLGLKGALLPSQEEYIGLIHRSGQHLHSVINDILDLAKVDAGKFELYEEECVDAREIVDACIELMKEQASAGALHLRAEVEPHLPLFVADPTRLKQILLNLLSNAIKFTEPGGRVVLIARPSADGGIAFDVRDTGPGMTADEIEIALQPFGQVEADHTRRHEGTGLGLSIARRLAELHGGSLDIKSEKGVGTTVSVTLPPGRLMALRPKNPGRQIA
jgi:signal transduction histidine kinase